MHVYIYIQALCIPYLSVDQMDLFLDYVNELPQWPVAVLIDGTFKDAG